MRSGQVDIGALALHDLPALVPWVVNVAASPDSKPTVVSRTLPIHARIPDLALAEGNIEAGRQASLLMMQGPEAFPFFPPPLSALSSSGPFSGRPRAPSGDRRGHRSRVTGRHGRQSHASQRSAVRGDRRHDDHGDSTCLGRCIYGCRGVLSHESDPSPGPFMPASYPG